MGIKINLRMLERSWTLFHLNSYRDGKWEQLKVSPLLFIPIQMKFKNKSTQ